MWYDRYIRECNKIGKAPSLVAEEIGLARSAVTKWKKGGTPTDATYAKLAEVFNCSVRYLKTGSDAPLVNNDPELTEYLEELKNRPEMRTLFSLAKGATKADVEKAVKIIEAFFEKD